MKIKTFPINPFFENTYVVFDEISKECLIIDPGCLNEIEESTIQNFIEKNELKVNAIINTHCHLDHVFGNKFAKEKFNAPLLIPREDKFLLDNASKQAAFYGIEMNDSPEPDGFLDDLKFVSIGNFQFKLLFTPGHTPGEFCLYNETEKICFTGDVLFKESIGRSDLPGGDYDTLIHSIKSMLITLPDETKIYPGHGEPSTIAYEKIHNPFLNS